MYGLAVYRSSIYLGPGVNLIHLISMCTFMGALLMVDLRLLGAGLTNQPVKHVARSAQPWLVGGIIGLAVTGIPALMSTATMQYASNVFWFKVRPGLRADFHVLRHRSQSDAVLAVRPRPSPWCRSCRG
jgi:hypothetical protein